MNNYDFRVLLYVLKEGEVQHHRYHCYHDYFVMKAGIIFSHEGDFYKIYGSMIRERRLFGDKYYGYIKQRKLEDDHHKRKPVVIPYAGTRDNGFTNKQSKEMKRLIVDYFVQQRTKKEIEEQYERNKIKKIMGDTV